jgi:hypothetical protein
MRPRLHLATAALLASLGPVPAAAQGLTSDADTREVLAYQLTMPKLRQMNQALADFQRQREADPAHQQLLRKKRELEALNGKDELSEAEMDRMAQLEEEIAMAEEEEDLGWEEGEDQSLSAMAERLAADPRSAGALRRAGLTPREAVTMQLAFIQAAFAAAMLESQASTQVPDGVNAGNVKFVQANKAEIATLTALQQQEQR